MSRYYCCICNTTGKELRFHATICIPCKVCLCAPCYKKKPKGFKTKNIEFQRELHKKKEHEWPIDIY